MIDTDKYEGHTVNRRDKLGTFKGTDIFVWDWFAQQLPVWASKADAQLIADAPLLLEEVKRLREAIKVATMDLEEPNMHEETRKDLLDMLKEMIE